MTAPNYLKVQISSGDNKLAEESAAGRTFKSGKKGYGYYGKIQIADKPENISVKLVDPEGNAVAEGLCPRRTFSSGKKGYGFYNKVGLNGDRFQATINFVQVNSDQDETDNRYQTGLNIVKIEK